MSDNATPVIFVLESDFVEINPGVMFQPLSVFRRKRPGGRLPGADCDKWDYNTLAIVAPDTYVIRYSNYAGIGLVSLPFSGDSELYQLLTIAGPHAVIDLTYRTDRTFANYRQALTTIIEAIDVCRVNLEVDEDRKLRIRSHLTAALDELAGLGLPPVTMAVSGQEVTLRAGGHNTGLFLKIMDIDGTTYPAQLWVKKDKTMCLTTTIDGRIYSSPAYNADDPLIVAILS